MLRRSVERQPVHLITEVSEEVGENLCGWSFFVSPPVTKLFPEILRDPRDLRPSTKLGAARATSRAGTTVLWFPGLDTDFVVDERNT
jgi:hypothetical protein